MIHWLRRVFAKRTGGSRLSKIGAHMRRSCATTRPGARRTRCFRTSGDKFRAPSRRVASRRYRKSCLTTARRSPKASTSSSWTRWWSSESWRGPGGVGVSLGRPRPTCARDTYPKIDTQRDTQRHAMTALIHELGALFEILDVCKHDLVKLLRCDHPPSDLLARIDKERGTIQDIEYLIVDLRAQIAAKELHKYILDEFKMTQEMMRVHI